MASVFISYGRHEEEIAKQIRGSLVKAGLVVYMPKEEFKPGAPIIEVVTNAMDASSCVLGIITPDSMNSPWVNQELGYAVASGKQTFLLVGGDVPVSGLLSGSAYIRFDEGDPQSAVNSVSKAIAEGSFPTC